MEITITDELKKIDSELIQYLITIPDKNNTITINEEYLDVYEIIKRNKHIYVNFKNNKKLTHIVNGLLYFGNEKILENILKKLGKYIKEKYINRKSVEKFFTKYIKKVCFTYLCKNTNMSEAFFKNYRSQIYLNGLCQNTNISEKFFRKNMFNIELYYLCRNTNISEGFFEKYIKNVNWRSLCSNTNLSESFFERHIYKVEWDALCLNTSISEKFFEKYIHLRVVLTSKNLFNNKNISKDFLKKHNFEEPIVLKDFEKNNIINQEYLTKNLDLSEDFFERQINKGIKIDWSHLCSYTFRANHSKEKNNFLFEKESTI